MRFIEAVIGYGRADRVRNQASGQETDAFSMVNHIAGCQTDWSYRMTKMDEK
jgi:hypothetical protein